MERQSSSNLFERSSDRFAALESRMLVSSDGAAAQEFTIGFRPPSNPPSSSAMEFLHRSPSPSMAAAAHTAGEGMRSPSPSPGGGGASAAAKRKQSPLPNPPAASPDKPDKRPKPVPSPGSKRASSRSPDVGSASASASVNTPSTSGGLRIDNFFAPKATVPGKGAAAAAAASPAPMRTLPVAPVASAAPSSSSSGPAQADSGAGARELREAQAAAEEHKQASDAARRQLAQGQAELEQAKLEAEAAHGAMAGMKEEIASLRDDATQERARQATGRSALREALREQCWRARAEARERLARESVRLGRLTPGGGAFRSGWVPKQGTAMALLQRRERSLEQRKAALEEDKKLLRKRKGGSGKAGAAGAADAAAAAEEAAELQDLEEAVKLRGSLLSREQTELAAEKKQLEREAHEHFTELQLMQDLDGLSDELRDCPSLPASGVVHEPRAPSNRADPGRFVLLDLIGTGGFATVFRAYDLQRHEFVACKLHSIGAQWTQARKDDFVRHVEREIDITVEMRHRRIVETYAAFELHEQAFVSVMPYCNGGSLADLLRRQGALPEKDAKSVLVGVLHGLRHLHSQREPIIHYDLKPANILFDDGEVKLSDFGLAKVMGADGGDTSQRGSMALTSYGSGTHGFLPPECYEGETSRICPKVDVFSAGVVFFVALFYPHKPFFTNATQEQIMRMKPHDIRAETQLLEFPGKVSAEAQAFLRRCLAPRRDDRPDVKALLDDPYFARSK